MSVKSLESILEKKISALETELKRYRDLFENAPIGIFQSTLESSRFINVNPVMARILGYETKEECMASVGNIARDLYVRPQRRKELLNQTIEKGQLVNFENSFRKMDGAIGKGRIHARVARRDDGAIEYLEGFFEEITEQKKISDALKRSEEHYRSIFENTGTGILIVEEDMTITQVNNEFERLVGYKKSELEGRMKWTEVVAFPEDRKRMVSYHKNRRKSDHNAPNNYEFVLVDKEHNKKNILARVDVIPGTGRSVGSFIDISPLVSAQQAVRENESKLMDVLEAFGGYIYTCSNDHKITFMNKNLKSMARERLSGQSCHEILFGLSTPCGWCPLKRVYGGETVKQEVRCPGSGRWYYAISSPISHVNDSGVKMQTVLIDIEERKQAELEMKAREERLQNENLRLKEAIKDRYKFCGIVGKSRAMQNIYELILRAAATDANVIIYGESGTGKELVARAIHAMSGRSENNFVPVNCGAIPSNLLESEFFGYKKGAFTGANQDKPGYLEHAEKGTLFLDELGEIDLNIQVKLLRILEGAGFTPVGGRDLKKTDVRIIGATNRNLNDLVKKGVMREDFFYRIHIIPIYLSPLRERKEDIPLLVEHFLGKQRPKNENVPISGSMLESLQKHDWPGNVRELENTLQRFVNLDNLEFLGTPPKDNKNDYSLAQDTGDLSLKEAQNRFKKEYITRVLEKNSWNRKKTATVLGVGRKTLYLTMKRLGIKQHG